MTEYVSPLTLSREDFLKIYKGTPEEKNVDLLYVNRDDYEGSHNKQKAIELGKKRLQNKLFRLNTLYYVKNKQGVKVLFRMNRGQHITYAASLRHPRVIVLKSRQIGISTLWLVSFFDDIVTIPNIEVGLISFGLGAAEINLEKIKFLWANLHPVIKRDLKVVNNNTKGFALSNGTKIYVKGTFRGATLHRLHISELGKIAADKKDVADEILSGTLQAIAYGNTVIIESTAEGPNKFMHLYNDSVKTASASNTTQEDFIPVFLSWLDDPVCVEEKHQEHNSESKEYFNKLSERGFQYTQEQVNFWIKKYGLLKERIYKEFPADSQDAFRASQEGAYYAKIYDEVIINNNRIKTGLFDPNLDVYLTMDIGFDDYFVLIYFQIGPQREVRIIDEYQMKHMDLLHYAEYIQANTFKNAFGEERMPEHIWFPHDIQITNVETGKSRRKLMEEYGVTGEVLKPEKVVEGIERTRDMLRNTWIEPHCDATLGAICNYKKEYSPRLGIFLERPKHDEYSHPADALRYAATVWNREVSDGGEMTDTGSPL